MTAPVLDPVRPAPAPALEPALDAEPRVQLRALPPTPGVETDRGRLVRRAVAAAGVVVLLSLFGVVVAHVVLTQNQFRLDELRGRSSTRQAEYDRLRLQVAELESPDRVVADAQQRLGMVAPAKVTYLSPTVEEPGMAGMAAAGPGRDRPAAGAETSWSTVKPHLADG
jgi:cell division protein FtsL